MYVTRPLSLFRNQPELLSIPPEEGLGSSYLIFQDVEDSKCVRNCFGRKRTSAHLSLECLPFPQNKLLTIEKSGSDYSHPNYAFFIPVIDEPLSSNRYYVIVADENCHEGLAYTSAREKDRIPSCFWSSYIPCKPPQELDPRNIHQQFQIFKRRDGSFFAKSPSPYSFPPSLLRSGWRMYTSVKSLAIGEARGLDSTLRSLLPDFSFPLSHERSFPLNIGKWFCPFMFIKEGTPKGQIEMTMFYELKLEQRWERIFTCVRGEGENDTVTLNVVVPTKVVKISGMDALCERDEVNGVMWFQNTSEMELQISIGVNLVIIERMMWEQERVGWAGRDEQQVTVERTKTYKGAGSWKKLGCYMLVEQYVLKRSNGSIVLTYDFNHTQRIRCKWE